MEAGRWEGTSGDDLIQPLMQDIDRRIRLLWQVLSISRDGAPKIPLTPLLFGHPYSRKDFLTSNQFPTL